MLLCHSKCFSGFPLSPGKHQTDGLLYLGVTAFHLKGDVHSDKHGFKSYLLLLSSYVYLGNLLIFLSLFLCLKSIGAGEDPFFIRDLILKDFIWQSQEEKDPTQIIKFKTYIIISISSVHLTLTTDCVKISYSSIMIGNKNVYYLLRYVVWSPQVLALLFTNHITVSLLFQASVPLLTKLR